MFQRFCFYVAMTKHLAFREWLVMVSAALLLVWSAPVQAEERVQDPAGLFSFVPPPGWTVSMIHSTRESEVRVDLVEQGAFMTIAAREVPNKMDWPRWKKTLIESMSQALDGLQSGPYKICGQEAVAMVGRPKDSPGDTVELVATEGEGIGLVLTMTYPSRLWRSFRPTLTQVLSSISCNFAK